MSTEEDRKGTERARQPQNVIRVRKCMRWFHAEDQANFGGVGMIKYAEQKEAGPWKVNLRKEKSLVAVIHSTPPMLIMLPTDKF